MSIAVFGANGPTGRLLVGRALAAGHHVVAVIRSPDEVPPRHRLRVVRADITDADAVDAVVAGCDSVVSAVGVPFSRKQISVYSAGTANVVAAMERHSVRRLVVVSNAPLDPDFHPTDSVLFTRVVEPYFMRKPGRTLYEDAARMEAVEDDRLVLRVVTVYTTEGTPTMFEQIWREGIRRPQKH